MKLYQGLLAAVACASACGCAQQVTAGQPASTDGGTTTDDGTGESAGAGTSGAERGGGGTAVPAGAPTEPLLARQVTVGVHSLVLHSIAIDDQWGSDRLQHMNKVLEANVPADIAECVSFGADIEVGVKFELADLEVFNVGDGNIETEEEYLEVAELPYDFKVVESISWCGCTQTEHPSILGCAEQKEAVVVALPGTSVEGVVWAHEYGHFAGLRHSNDGDNVMFDTASKCKVLLSEEQRRLYRAPTDQPAPAQTCGYGGLAVLPPAEDDGALEDQIREFVTATHVHGLSYEQAREFGRRPHALEYLLTLLEDPVFREHHGQIALAIGAIGGEQAIERLTAYVEGVEPGAESLPALRVALPAIGWALSAPEAEPLVEKTLAFLSDRTQLGFWKELVAGLTADERDALAADLVGRAAMGLAFSGRNVRDSLEQAFAEVEDEDLQELFQHMSRVNQAIQESPGGSLAAYYAGRR